MQSSMHKENFTFAMPMLPRIRPIGMASANMMHLDTDAGTNLDTADMDTSYEDEAPPTGEWNERGAASSSFWQEHGLQTTASDPTKLQNFQKNSEN